LRATFTHTEGQWRQSLVPCNALDLDAVLCYVSELPESSQISRIGEMIQRRQGGMDLSRAPLIQVMIFNHGVSGYVIRLNLNHLLADQVASEVLFDD